jgi:hypothetical protein
MKSEQLQDVIKRLEASDAITAKLNSHALRLIGDHIHSVPANIAPPLLSRASLLQISLFFWFFAATKDPRRRAGSL